MRFGLFTGLVFGLLTGCGAFEEESSPLVIVQDCPTAGSQLAYLTELVETGQLQGMQQALSERVEADVRTRLVALLFALLDQYDPGTFLELSPVVESGVVGGFVDGLRGPLERIVELEAWPPVGVLGQALQQCTGRPLLVTLRALLVDPAARADIEILLSGSLDLEGALESFGLDLTTIEGRLGFQVLLRSVLISLTQPDFDISSLTGPDGLVQLLSFEGDPTLDALIRIVERLLSPGSPLESVQLVTDCLLDVDPEDLVTGLAFDILTASDSVTLPELSLYPGGTVEALDRLLLPLLDLLVERAYVRQSAVVVLSSLLEPSVAAQFLPDVIVLLDADAIQGLLELTLLLVGGGGC